MFESMKQETKKAHTCLIRRHLVDNSAKNNRKKKKRKSETLGI